MAQEDGDSPDTGSPPEPYVPDGRRRSTFTPAPAAEQSDGLAGETLSWASPDRVADSHDDDELAIALAEEVSRYTGSTPVILPTVTELFESAVATPIERPAPPVPHTEPALPVPPTEAVAPRSLPPRPHRRSLPDEDLLRAVGDQRELSAGAGPAIDTLESQLRLREEEARDFQAWESAMRAIGTAEALEQVEQARGEFTGVIPIVSPAVEAEPIHPAAAQPATRSADEPAWSVPTPAQSVWNPWTEPAQSEHDTPHQEFDELLAASSPDSPAATATRLGSVGGAGSPAPGVRSPHQPSWESSGVEPTPLDQRVGRAVQLFWLWFAANSSVITVAIGATVFSLGLSLRQSVIATLAGVAVSFLPLGLGTLAGKRSGQPVMVVSRAVFGLVGNIVPATLALIIRVFWAAALLWLFALTSGAILAGGGSGTAPLTTGMLVVGFLVIVGVALFGYGWIVRIQSVLSIVSALSIVGFIAATSRSIHLSTALSTADGPWTLVIGGIVLVFSFTGLAWATSSGDLARYQRPAGPGGDSMLWSTFGVALPAFVLVSYGSLLAASNPSLVGGLIADPIQTISAMLPGWYALPLMTVASLSLLSGAIISLYSGAFALQAIGSRIRREWAVAAVSGGLVVMTLVISLGIHDFAGVFRDLATTVAVPVAAWAGIFAAELMIRNRRFSTRSLLGSGGLYPMINWLNSIMLVVASLVGFGLTTASLGWLDW
ncbi:MAG: purine-cytosine permease family protein, partial [Microbacteriaceae bacterium]